MKARINKRYHGNRIRSTSVGLSLPIVIAFLLLVAMALPSIATATCSLSKLQTYGFAECCSCCKQHKNKHAEPCEQSAHKRKPMNCQMRYEVGSHSVTASLSASPEFISVEFALACDCGILKTLPLTTHSSDRIDLHETSPPHYAAFEKSSRAPPTA